MDYMAGTEVWSGEGYVPGYLPDTYSGLAKAYGLYTALSFLLPPSTIP